MLMSEQAIEIAPAEVAHEAAAPKRLARLAGRAAMHLAGGALVALPFAAVHSLSHAEATDDVGPLPTTVQLAPDHSSVDLGPLGTFYNKKLTEKNVGLAIEVNGLPQTLPGLGNGNLSKAAKPFVGLYQNPRSATEGYREAVMDSAQTIFIKTEVAVGLGAAGLSLLIAGQAGELAAAKRRRLALSTVGSLGLLSCLAAAYEYREWNEEHRMPEATVAVSGVEDTMFAGTRASDPFLSQAAGSIAPLIQREQAREQASRELFLQNAYASIDAAIESETFTPPTEGETAVLVLSDLHSNHAMIEAYRYAVEKLNEAHGEDTINLTLLVGDQTYGSATERDAVEDISRISDEMYAISGNHDGELTEQASEENGITLLENETITTEDDIEVLGGPDPELTRLSALFGFDEDVSRDGSNHAEAGQLLADEAEETNPTFLLSHEAYTLAPVIGKDDISKASMEEWLTSPSITPDIDLDASAIMYGHWHDKFLYKVVRNEIGQGRVVMQLATAGGASGSMSLSKLSFPWTVPAKTASGIIVTVNNSTQLVTSLQEMRTDTSGLVSFQETHEIPQPEIAPFDLLPGANKKPGPREDDARKR